VSLLTGLMVARTLSTYNLMTALALLLGIAAARPSVWARLSGFIARRWFDFLLCLLRLIAGAARVVTRCRAGAARAVTRCREVARCREVLDELPPTPQDAAWLFSAPNLMTALGLFQYVNLIKARCKGAPSSKFKFCMTN
jgi:hypothetical protein